MIPATVRCVAGSLERKYRCVPRVRPPSLHLRALPPGLCDLFRRLIEPVLESRFAEPRVPARNERPLAHLNAVVAGLRVRDDLAWIVARSQVPPDDFIQTKLFGASDLDGG